MSIKVMVVDDSRLMHAQMSYLLENTEFEIVAFCRDGEEAFASYELCNPDIVTMDIIMPGMDGMEAAADLLSVWPNARIVIVSSLDYDETRQQAKKIGVLDFIDKPFEKEQVIEVLTRVANTMHL